MARSQDRRGFDRERYPRDRRDERDNRRRSRSRERRYNRDDQYSTRDPPRDQYRDRHRADDRDFRREHDGRGWDRGRDRDYDRKRYRDSSPVRGDERNRQRDPRDTYDDRDRKRSRPEPSSDNASSPRSTLRSNRDGRLSPPPFHEHKHTVSSVVKNENCLSLTSQPSSQPLSRQESDQGRRSDQGRESDHIRQSDQGQDSNHGRNPDQGPGSDQSRTKSPEQLMPPPQLPKRQEPVNDEDTIDETRRDEWQARIEALRMQQLHAARKEASGLLSAKMKGKVKFGAKESAQGKKSAPVFKTIAKSAEVVDGTAKSMPKKVVEKDTPIKLSASDNPGKVTQVEELSEDHPGRIVTGFGGDIDEPKKLLQKMDFSQLDTSNQDMDMADADEQIGELDDEAREIAEREAVKSRAEQAQQLSMQSTQADIDMPNADDDIDPLDAFMETIQVPTGEVDVLRDFRNGKQGNKLYNSDDEDDLDPVGDGLDDLDIKIKKTKKELPTIDHKKMNYEEFRKNFYNEPTELADMTDEEVEILRAELDNITVRGNNVPKPLTVFAQGGFGSSILDIIDTLKYEKPSAIQAQALPAILSGRDTIGVAKTGSGKTMAYLLPMFRHVKDQRPVENLEGPIALIISPTRELAIQIYRQCQPFLKALNLRGVCAYGGAPISEQIAEFKRGAEVVVATPGRLIDLLAANSGRVTNLKRVTYLVMDEADRMFDMGFEPQITRIVSGIRPNRQTVLFSATFPKKLETMARKTLNDPVEITVGGVSIVPPEIEQVVEVREQKSKFKRLLELLGQNHIQSGPLSLIFVERQEVADLLYMHLRKVGYATVTIHGGRDQVDRDANIANFKAGHIPVLVATSVAARGLDVKQLSLVVNFDCPNHNEDYVHRCGRTGRAGETGLAVTFITPEQDRFAPFLVKALKDSNAKVPEALENLATQFKEKVKAGTAKEAGNGFGGHGIEDEKKQLARDSDRQLMRIAMGIDDAPDDEKDKKKKIDGDQQQTEIEKKIAAAASGIMSRNAPAATADPVAVPAKAPEMQIDASIQQVIDNAMIIRRSEAPQRAKPNGAPLSKQDAQAQAKAAAAAIAARIAGKGTASSGRSLENNSIDAAPWHSYLDINDLPQKARWAVTNRSNVAKILENTGASITTKGSYYAPGVEPGASDPEKLRLLVEGERESVVHSAMLELLARMREGLVEDMAMQAMQKPAGRYTI